MISGKNETNSISKDLMKIIENREEKKKELMILEFARNKRMIRRGKWRRRRRKRRSRSRRRGEAKERN